MSGYLIDTNAISLLSASRASASFVGWLKEQQQRNSLYVSSITLQETEKGIVKLELVKAGNPAKAKRLRLWLETVMSDFQDRFLPVDTTVALAAGRLEGAALARGQNFELADILIAATAVTHHLTVVTANVKDFEPLGVECLAPF
ncbi:type II toxin-antitoxin system VapC family toxin [Rhizobium sp. CECT 9324]|uniref:type II toxin-antitoxin system VapC family toxin n=1 Tax=Rhizobium sp. CECT 9324 TaxID=2845820 RepID=UPI001E468A9B|nr:type II toxin-antitoxin system VapC family toxin [Rhizobium sp. CECT 9324]CAH0341968.1 tRNA(fMet)-specific endonuclease VapC [Rhizobium sp. CECT 9324]